ncbi:hypothetical protein [Streptomyces sp.]|uniref:hypothetical protein n=1 Tax=Streptomyces sp. TaxID=1931 RepID=UPI002F936406
MTGRDQRAPFSADELQLEAGEAGEACTGSTPRTAADVDRHAAATRALTALGEQWKAAAGPDRHLLVSCMRQGLALAREYRLDLDWLTEAAYAYTADDVWEPLPLPDADDDPATPADALAELLATLARRRHENGSRTVERLTEVLDTDLLPAELAGMALYFRAKAHHDLGQTEAFREDMQQVAAGGGRYAPDAARGLAHLARAAGDFPAALATAETLGRPGRGHRVLGDIHFAHGDMHAAAAAYAAARAEAEDDGNPGEQAIAQTHLALAVAFTDPGRADDEIARAEQLLSGLDQRATRLTAQIAALVRHAGTSGPEFEDRAAVLRGEVIASGISAAAHLLGLAAVFDHAVRGEVPAARDVLTRLREFTQNGDHAYHLDIGHHLAGLTPPANSTVIWAEDLETVRARWHDLVARRATTIQYGPSIT